MILLNKFSKANLGTKFVAFTKRNRITDNKNLKFILLISFIILYNYHNIKSDYINYAINKNLNVKSKNFTRFEKCYLPPDNANLKIIHLIITRFIMPFWNLDNFTKKIYSSDYLLNGIRVMKKYLFPSLENQYCKNFIWILLLGDKANITKVKSFLNINLAFKYYILNKKSFEIFLKNIKKKHDILITTRIDYDDMIYYDAVNDVRKAVNKNKPVILYGYNIGLIYFEFNNKYYQFYPTFGDQGTSSIFASLILVLSKVNKTITVYDLGAHNGLRKRLLNNYKYIGIKNLNYEPANFDNGEVNLYG